VFGRFDRKLAFDGRAGTAIIIIIIIDMFKVASTAASCGKNHSLPGQIEDFCQTFNIQQKSAPLELTKFTR